MRRPAAFFAIVLALAAVIFTSPGGAQAQDAREGPREIEKCRTISKPGSYKLVNDIAPTPSTSTNGDCLVITASFVTIDLGGFTISGGTTGIVAAPSSGQLQGIAVRNGSISNFGGIPSAGVDLGAADGSIVEGLRVFGGVPSEVGISAKGIVRGNTVVGIFAQHGLGTGISATGTVTGNYVTGSGSGIAVGQGSTVIGNTATDNPGAPGNPLGGFGIVAVCPSNLTDNTAVNNKTNLVLNGDGCHSEDNVAP
jgi:hypothetical protein